MPILSHKNVNYVISTLYYAKKSIGYPFFPILHEKNNSSYANILSKNVGTFSKNTLFFHPYFVNKRIFSQIFMYFFFKLVLEKPPILMPTFGQRNVNSDKNTLYYGPKKSIDPFFLFFIKKYNTALIPIFCRKPSILTKTGCSHVIFFF